MHRIIALLALLLFVAPAAAQESPPRPVSQIALLPLPASGADDVAALLKAHWGQYFETGTDQGFGRDAVRIGYFDLNGDGKVELLVMVTRPDWATDAGQPIAVAAWTGAAWNAIGWSWGDEDTVFATDEIVARWRTIDTGSQWLRWDNGLYGRVDKEGTGAPKALDQ